MEDVILQTNRRALAALSDSDFSYALSLLKFNAKKYPCHLTLNNLGRFYCDEGQDQKDGCWESAKALGLRYLINASKLEKRYINLFNIGTVLYSLEKVDEAYQYFHEASALEHKGLTQYNMGVCLLALKKYSAAEQIFYQLMQNDTTDIVSKGGSEPIIPYIFSRYLNITCPLSTNIEDIESIPLEIYDKLTLNYLCGNYHKVIEYSPAFLEEWYPSEEIIAMIFDSIEKEGVFVSKKKEQIMRLFPNNKRIQQLADCTKIRERCIKKYIYVPPLIEICGYYGCEIHNTPI